jgi:hypothetical protein
MCTTPVPPSNVNSDARIGFYAKFYVGNNIAGGSLFAELRQRSSGRKKIAKKWDEISLIT